MLFLFLDFFCLEEVLCVEEDERFWDLLLSFVLLLFFEEGAIHIHIY